MPAALHILLRSEEAGLMALRLAQRLPQCTHDRAQMLRLNVQGWNVPAIVDTLLRPPCGAGG